MKAQIMNVSSFKLIVLMGIITLLSETFTFAQKSAATGSIYDFKMKAIDGKEVDFSTFKGKPLLIVNTASKCGFTPQYADLEKLHEQYGQYVTILGFPANNFLWQEPGSNSDIATFCSTHYNVSFPMFEKISVKGRDRAPLYKWLEAKSGHKPSWNFCKYLIDKDGNVAGFYPSSVNPMDSTIIKQIKP